MLRVPSSDLRFCLYQRSSALISVHQWLRLPLLVPRTGYKFNTAWRGGNGDADNIFEDYKPFDGILFATKVTSHDGKDMNISYTDNVSFDDVAESALQPPAQVQAELAKAKIH